MQIIASILMFSMLFSATPRKAKGDIYGLDVRLKIARSLKASGKLDAAEKAYRDLLKYYPNNPDGLKELAEILSTKKSGWSEAIRLLKKYLKMRPKDADAHYLLGQLYIYKSDLRNAEKELRTTVKLNPKNIMAKLYLARVLYWEGKGKEAVKYFEDVEKTKPSLFTYKSRLEFAYSLLQAGKYTKAKSIFVGLQSGGDRDALFGLAVTEEKLGNYSKALKYLRRILSKYPDDVNSIIEIARIYAAQGLTSKAIEYYKKALKYRPNDKNLKFEYIQVASSNPKTARELLSEIEEYVRRNPNNLDYQLEYAHILSNIPERRADAIKIYRRILEKYPNEMKALKGLRDAVIKMEARPDMIPIYLKLLQKFPNDVNLRLKIADAYKNAGKPDVALSWYKSVLRYDPGNVWANLGIGGIYINQKQYDQAIIYYKRVLRKDPRNYYALVGLGGAYLALGDKESALKYYRKAYKIKQTAEVLKAIKEIEAENRVEMAEKLKNQGNYAKALLIYKKLLAQNPTSKRILLGIATCYHELGQDTKAIEYYNRILELNPEDKDAIIGKGWALLGLGKYQAAIDLIKSHNLINDPDGIKIIQQAQIQYYIKEAEKEKKQGHYDKALKYYLAARQIAPDNLDLLRGLAGVYMAMKKYDEAASVFSLLLQKFPNDTTLLRAYGDALYASGDLDKAIKVYEELYKRTKSPEVLQKIAKIKYTDKLKLAEYFKSRGKLEKALEIYQKLYQENPADIGVILGLAGVYFDLGKYEEARKLYSQVLVLDPSNKDALQGLVGSLIKLKKEDEALTYLISLYKRYKSKEIEEQIKKVEVYRIVKKAEEYKKKHKYYTAFVLYRKAYQLDPNNIDVLKGLAGLYAANGQLDEAAKLYEHALQLNPDDEDVAIDLARVYRGLGRDYSALRILKRLNVGSLDPRIALEYAKILYSLNRKYDALKVLEVAELNSNKETKKGGEEFLPPFLPEDTLEAIIADTLNIAKEIGIENISKNQLPPLLSLGPAIQPENFFVLRRQEAIYYIKQFKEKIQRELRAYIQLGPYYRQKSGTKGTSYLELPAFPVQVSFPLYNTRVTIQADAEEPGNGVSQDDGIGAQVTFEGPFTPGSFYLMAGITPMGFAGGTNFKGDLRFTFLLSDFWGFYLRGFVLPNDESYLAYVGEYAPKIGKLHGKVMETGGELGLVFRHPPKDLSMILGTSVLRGIRVYNNNKYEGLFRVGYSFKMPMYLDVLRVGFDFYLMSFKSYLGDYTIGHGGYFSPTFFSNNAIVMSLQRERDNLFFKLYGSAGAQYMRGPLTQYFKPGTKFGFSLGIDFEYFLSKSLLLGVNYNYNDVAPYFQDHRIWLFIRYYL